MSVDDFASAKNGPNWTRSGFGGLPLTVAGYAVELGEHALPQDLVLLTASSRGTRWPVLHLTADDNFPGPELISRQVRVLTVGQPIPVMVADLDILDEDLAEYQLSAEQILNDKRRHSALAPSGIVRPPIPHVVRVAGVRSPTGSKYRAQYLQVEHLTSAHHAHAGHCHEASALDQIESQGLVLVP